MILKVLFYKKYCSFQYFTPKNACRRSDTKPKLIILQYRYQLKKIISFLTYPTLCGSGGISVVEPEPDFFAGAGAGEKALAPGCYCVV